jgi:hypothetical protein
LRGSSYCSRRIDLVFPADLSQWQLGKLLTARRATTALVRWASAESELLGMNSSNGMADGTDTPSAIFCKSSVR